MGSLGPADVSIEVLRIERTKSRFGGLLHCLVQAVVNDLVHIFA